MQSNPPTIFAPATGLGRAGVAVIRISGSGAGLALSNLCGRSSIPARRMVRVQISQNLDPAQVIDDGLAVWFPGPASFTGEDVLELHCHGGRAVTAAILAALGGLPGYRPAEPGEFTKRAFLNEKLDLTSAEGLADLIDAETDAQRSQALRQLRGELGALYERWRQRLIAAQAHFEVEIDFSDEDIPEDLAVGVQKDVSALRQEVINHLSDGRRGERLRDGVAIAIIGPPNAGKSSLLNALARRDAAIVSETAGTTRDVVEVHLDLGGFPCLIADTAGLREAEDAIEAEGVRRALARAEEADLRLAVFDGSGWPLLDQATLAAMGEGALAVINKADLAAIGDQASVEGHPTHVISVKTGRGMDRLIADLAERVADLCDQGGDLMPTRARHRHALEQCLQALDGFLGAANLSPELAAEDLRLAARALGRITGRVDVEDLLDVIFSDFCIGK